MDLNCLRVLGKLTRRATTAFDALGVMNQ